MLVWDRTTKVRQQTLSTSKSEAPLTCQICSNSLKTHFFCLFTQSKEVPCQEGLTNDWCSVSSCLCLSTTLFSSARRRAFHSDWGPSLNPALSQQTCLVWIYFLTFVEANIKQNFEGQRWKGWTAVKKLHFYGAKSSQLLLKSIYKAAGTNFYQRIRRKRKDRLTLLLWMILSFMTLRLAVLGLGLFRVSVSEFMTEIVQKVCCHV